MVTLEDVTRLKGEGVEMSIEVQVATLVVELSNAKEDIKDLKTEVSNLKRQRTNYLIWGIITLGGAVSGLITYIFSQNHPPN